MVHIVLVRHGESSANAAGILAGRTPGVSLTPAGEQQIRGLAEIFPFRTVTEVRCSTVQRCRETAALLLTGITAPGVREAPEFAEVDYGTWSGRRLAELKELPEWQRVARSPSSMEFPGGESLRDAAARAVTGVDAFVADLRARQVPDAGAGDAGGAGGTRVPVGVVVAHGDIIKAVLAAALDMPLDAFQRIAVAPGSLSVVTYPETGYPTVTAMSVTASGRTGEAGAVGGGR
ncbi:histidine phosphatase family protein [Brevibacterium sp. NPDC049920]|uniref:Histidine phosphatase family protein n=1 Tax=Brevibacterium pityocampae TaxID=506594 RepID=A0ABP8JD82_9MICO